MLKALGILALSFALEAGFLFTIVAPASSGEAVETVAADRAPSPLRRLARRSPLTDLRAAGRSPGMHVRINGELREVPEGTTVAGLLAHLGVRAQRVAVEVNETVVTKDRYDDHRISQGDAVEIVAFVGGG